MSAERSATDAAAALDTTKFRPVYGNTFTLLFDFDTAEAYQRFMLEFRPLLREKFGEWKLLSWKSKTPGHWHVSYETTQGLEPAQRIAVQAACGSDPNRELLSVVNILKGDADPSVLFQPVSAVIL